MATVAAVVWLLVTVRRHEVVRSLGLALLLIVVGSPTVWPWYLMWGVVLLAATTAQRSKVLAAVAGLAMLVVGPSGHPLLLGNWYLVVSLATVAGVAWLIRGGHWRSVVDGPCRLTRATGIRGTRRRPWPSPCSALPRLAGVPGHHRPDAAAGPRRRRSRRAVPTGAVEPPRPVPRPLAPVDAPPGRHLPGLPGRHLGHPGRHHPVHPPEHPPGGRPVGQPLVPPGRRVGWPRHLPYDHGHVAGSTIAFFPLFPLSIRWLSHLTGLSLLAAGITITTVTGLHRHDRGVGAGPALRRPAPRPIGPPCWWPCSPGRSCSAWCTRRGSP